MNDLESPVARPPLSRPPLARDRRLGAPRRIALLALISALGVGVAIACRPQSPSESGRSISGPRPVVSTAFAPSSTSSTSSTPRSARARTFTADVGDTAGCQALVADEPQLLCPMSGGVVTYAQVADVHTGYDRVARAAAVTRRGDHDGCATGLPDERAWARPESPEVVAGRYVCRVDRAAAEIWWTVDDVDLLGHAVRRDGDLAALFSWWRAHDEHP
jgi:hypothetical protein